VPTSTSTSVPTILPTPSSIVSFEERLLATIDIKYPDELAFVQGFIWVKTDDGHVIQVDPATNSVVGDIKVDTTSDPSHYCQGLGTDGENIWACSASGDEELRTIDVVRIDPNSQSVVETVKIGKIFDQFNMPFLLNQIWVLSDNGDKLVGIDITTNQPSPAIDLGARCFQVAAVDRSLLVTCRLDNFVLRIDPEKMEVTERLTFPSPRNITTTENGIWLSQDNAVVRLDKESLNPVTTFTKLFNADIFATKEAVWVRLEDGFLFRIDPAGNQLIEQIKTDQNLSLGSILVTPDSIWTTAGDDDLLIRLSLK
jgi:DNA-binding beta-propeller fold protein YncE